MNYKADYLKIKATQLKYRQFGEISFDLVVLIIVQMYHF